MGLFLLFTLLILHILKSLILLVSNQSFFLLNLPLLNLSKFLHLIQGIMLLILIWILDLMNLEHIYILVISMLLPNQLFLLFLSCLIHCIYIIYSSFFKVQMMLLLQQILFISYLSPSIVILLLLKDLQIILRFTLNSYCYLIKLSDYI